MCVNKHEQFHQFRMMMTTLFYGQPINVLINSRNAMLYQMEGTDSYETDHWALIVLNSMIAVRLYEHRKYYTGDF